MKKIFLFFVILQFNFVKAPIIDYVSILNNIKNNKIALIIAVPVIPLVFFWKKYTKISQEIEPKIENENDIKHKIEKENKEVSGCGQGLPGCCDCRIGEGCRKEKRKERNYIDSDSLSCHHRHNDFIGIPGFCD